MNPTVTGAFYFGWLLNIDSIFFFADTESSCKAGLAVQLCIDVICILLLGLLSSFLPFAQSGEIEQVGSV